MSEDCCSPNLEQWLVPELFRALSDPNRLSILAWLARSDEDQTVTDVGSCCSVDLSVVSRHLRTLREAGVVAAERHGKEVRYRLQARELATLLRNLADALEACCPDERTGVPGDTHDDPTTH